MLVLWKSKTLSRAGRLTLIKVMLNNLPMYYLNLIKIPKNVAKKIIQLQRNIFWLGDDKRKGLLMIQWEMI